MALEINTDTDHAIEHPFNRHAEGISTNTIVAELNQMGFRGQKGSTFTRNTVRAWYRNPYPFAGCLARIG